MDKILYILIILIFFSSCTKTIEVPLDDQSVIAYQKNIDEYSFDIQDNKFYFLSEEDSTLLNYYTLTPNGVFEMICNVNDYFPANYTVDSILNYKAKTFDDNSKAIAFSYLGKGKKVFSVLKLNQSNQVKWQLTDTITDGTDGYSLENISINTNGNIDVLFSTNRPTPNLQTIIYINSYDGTNGEVILKTQIAINGLVIQVCPVSGGGAMIFSGEPEGAPGTGNLVYKNLKIWLYKDSQLKSVETGLSILSYYMSLSQDQDNFIVSGLTESYSALLFSVSLDNGVNWETYFSKSEIKGITNSNDGYIVTGKEFNTLSEGSILMAKVNKEGVIVWNEPFDAESYGLGIIEEEETLYWFGTTNHESVIPESFFLLKTDNLGVVK